MTYLSAGCPILALIERQSELSEVIAANNIGITPKNLSIKSISETILAGYGLRNNEDYFDRKRVRTFGEEIFGKKKVLALWCSLLIAIEAEKAVPVQRLWLKNISPAQFKRTGSFKSVEKKVVA